MRRRSGHEKALVAIVLGLGSALVAALLWNSSALERLEGVTWTWRARWLARPGAATPRIRTILVDQASLDWARRVNKVSWPWPREAYARILDFCRRARVRAVVFDVLFTEPSYLHISDDEAFAESIRHTPQFVGAIFLGRDGEFDSWPDGVPWSGPEVALSGPEEVLFSPAAVAERATFPIPELARHMAWVADVRAEPDEDLMIRRVRLLRRFGHRWVPSLSLAAWLAAEKTERGEVPGLRLEPGRLWIGNRSIPLDESGRAWLRFRGPSGTHKAYSAAAILQAELRLAEGAEEPPPVLPEELEGTYVFLGFSAPGLMDLRPTPMSDVYPGVEVHATALDNLLSGDFLRPLSRQVVHAMLSVAGLLGAFGTAMAHRAWQSVVVLVAAAAAPAGLGFVAYEVGYVLPIVPVLFSAVLAAFGGMVYNYATEGRQKAFLKQAFRHYLSPVVIDRLLEDPSQLRLGGERRVLTIFFSDLQGFSSISEKLDPERLTALLNDYLTDMTDLILEEGGTLDKYEGDAIIAFWNAPLTQPDHPVRAVRAALRCQQRLAERRAEFRARCGVDLFMRIGIHTGEVVVGNMGSRERFDYTVLGDAANLASRLEGANKAFGTFVMVSETTWAVAGAHFDGRELARLRVVGRRAPVRVFEPAERGRAPAEWADFARGRAAFEVGRFEEALRIFDSLTADPAARAYAVRCRLLIERPPADWDGVWTLSEK